MSKCYNSGCGSESYNGKHFAEHTSLNCDVCSSSSNTYIKMGANLGWQCPICGYVWGPFVQGCQNCNKSPESKWSTTCTTNPETIINLKG